MKAYVEGLEREFSAIERGFRAEESRARADYESFDSDMAARVAYLAYGSEVYQVRMYAVFLLGHLSQDPDVLSFLRNDVSADSNWRVQEVLAKAFDDFCAVRGYEEALPVIDEWLSDTHPNVRRAVTEGLRIWTSRPYFRDHPGGCCLTVVEAARAIRASTSANPWEMHCGTSARNIRTWLQPNWKPGVWRLRRSCRFTALLPNSSSTWLSCDSSSVNRG